MPRGVARLDAWKLDGKCVQYETNVDIFKRHVIRGELWQPTVAVAAAADQLLQLPHKG